MLLPDPDGPTKNEQAPGGTSNETPRSAWISSSPLRNDLRTSDNADHAGLHRGQGFESSRSQEASLRMASMGVMREARQAGYRPASVAITIAVTIARGDQLGREIEPAARSG